MLKVCKVQNLCRPLNAITLNSVFDVSLLIYICTHTALAWEPNFTMLRHLSFLVHLIITVFFCLKKGKKNFLVDEFLLWHVGFIILSILSVFWAPYPGKTIRINVSLIMTLVILFPIRLRVNTLRDLEILMKILLYSSVFMGLYALLGTPAAYWGYDRLGNIVGINPNFIALQCSIGVLFSFYFAQDKNNSKYTTVLYYTIQIVLAYIVILTGSKTGIILIALGILIYCYYQSKMIYRPIIIGAAVLFLILLVFAIIYNDTLNRLYASAFISVYNVLTGRSGYVDISSSDRMGLLIDAVRLFLKSPIYGWGLDNFSSISGWGFYTHNNYTELACGLGILGLLSFLWLPIKQLFTLVLAKKQINRLRSLMKCFLILFFVEQVTNINYSTMLTYIYLLLIYKSELVRNK